MALRLKLSDKLLTKNTSANQHAKHSDTDATTYHQLGLAKKHGPISSAKRVTTTTREKTVNSPKRMSNRLNGSWAIDWVLVLSSTQMLLSGA
jgi:hypothetical protein